MATLNIFTETPATFQGQDLHLTKVDAVARTDAEVVNFPVAAWPNAADEHFERINKACQGLEDWGEIGKTFTCAGSVVVDQTFTATGLATFDAAVTLDSASADLTIGDGTGSTDLVIQKSDAGSAEFRWNTDSGSGLNSHWIVGMFSSEDLLFARRNADGTTNDTPLALDWGTGNVTFANDISAVDGTFTGIVDMQGAYCDLPTNSGAPTAVTARMYYDTSDNIAYIYNGTVWKALYA